MIITFSFQFVHNDINVLLNLKFLIVSRGLNLFSADIIPASIMNSQYLPGSVQCGVITEIYVIPTYGRYSMTCIQYNFGRYVLIRKLRRSGSISLSEVEIHVRKLILF